MTLTSIFTKSELTSRWRSLDEAWRWTLVVFLIARIGYTLWSWVLLTLNPMPVQNFTLFGAPVLAVFDLGSSQRFVYSRDVKGSILLFHAVNRNTLIDTETQSLWNLSSGSATSGAYNGFMLDPAPYTPEDLFPYNGVNPVTVPLVAVWQRFDSNWYLKIAERGYASDDGSTVYFPVYPLLIRLVGTVIGGNDLIAALAISNFALIGVLYFLYQFSVEFVGDGAARRAPVYFVLFPTAFFLFAAYTESVFLLFAMGSLYAGRRNQWLLAGILGAFAALTRLQGALVLLPLAYLWLRAFFPAHNPAGPGDIEMGRARSIGNPITCLALLLIPASTLLFLAYSNLTLLASYENQLHGRFVLPWENLFSAFALVVGGSASYIEFINILVTMLFGVMCIAVWRKLPREFGIYALAMFLAPLFRMTTSQPLVSMSRYALAIFPIFILWGGWGANPWVNRAILYLSLPLALFLSAQFWTWGWVA